MSTNTLLDSIDWGGNELRDNVVSVYFAPAGTELNTYWFTEDSEGFNAYEKAQFQKAFDAIEAVTNLKFVISQSQNADLRLVLDTDEMGWDTLGYFNPPGETDAGVGVFNGTTWSRSPGGDLEVGGFSYVTVVHELLHGLGLAHPHDNGGGSSYMWGVYSDYDDYGNYDLNQGIYTTMTYNAGYPVYDYAFYNDYYEAEYNFGYEAGPMALDIAILQEKYGANQTTARGDTTYKLVDKNAAGTYWESIWDTGGTDRIVYTGKKDVTIDLRAATLEYEEGGGGFVSHADGIMGGFTIANGVMIEGARGGSGDDTITGNAGKNALFGRNGADILTGNAGRDKLKGGGGADILLGGTGNDVLLGQRGDDWLTGNSGRDTFVFQRKSGDDIISDFTIGEDIIKLKAIDANTGKAGNQKFRFIGEDEFGGYAGQLRAELSGTETLLQGDTNGDGKADFTITLEWIWPDELSTSDFIL